MTAESAINMHQINLEPLLKIAGQGQIEQTARLDPAQYYPARLQTTPDGGVLQLQTGPAQLHMQLSAFQVRQILQSTSVSTTVVQNASPSQNNNSGQNLSSPSDAQTSSTANQQSALQSNNPAGLAPVKLQVRLQPVGNQELLLSVRTQPPAVQLPLTAQSLLPLLLNPPAAAGTALSLSALQLAGAHHNGTVVLSALLSKTGNLLQLTLPGEPPLRLNVADAAHSNLAALDNLPVELRLHSDGKLTIQLIARDAGKPLPTFAANAQTASSAGQQPDQSLNQQAAVASRNQSMLQLNLLQADNKTLLPALARQLWPQQLSIPPEQPQRQPAGPQPAAPAHRQAGAMLQHLLQAHPTAIGPGKDLLQWQLSEHKQGFLLQLQAVPALQTIRLGADAISRPLQFLPATATNSEPVQPAIKDLWRQLLPLAPQQTDPLRIQDDLPAPVRQILQFLQQQHPDGKTLLSNPQLQQQLQAASQFQPLQPAPALNTAAGALAAAIGLLLGRLSGTAMPDRPVSPTREKLQLMVSQLDKTQSSQLLKQLAGHSGQFQATQLATLEPQQQKSAEPQIFLQLPLLCGQESRMAELCITEQKTPQNANSRDQRAWQLTMKFNLGNQGELLAKVTLQGNQLSMQFYTQNSQLVQTAERFFPLLKDRLKMQGLQVDDISCQLGRIPAHLYQQGTQLLQVRV